MIKLRKWQSEAVEKCLKWYSTTDDKRFVINAAPGTGKTLCSIIIADKLIKEKKIERLIVIAPMNTVVEQWAQKYKEITGRFMQQSTKLTSDEGADICCTWQSVNSMIDGFQHICNNKKTMVICDEHHHTSILAAWGIGAHNAFKNAKNVLILTGTPIRTDGVEPVWLSYKDGELSHPKEGQYTLTYGESIPEFCRPITFGRKQATFHMLEKKGGNWLAKVSGKQTEIAEEINNSPVASAIQDANRFYTCAVTPIRKKDGTADTNSFQAQMLLEGIEKLDDRRLRLPQAGGLVIAPSIPTAEYMAELLEIFTGKKPVIVHNKIDNPEDKIKRFKENLSDDWLVSVQMVGEGVDIPRLRVLVFLPKDRTELKFRQAIGRVIRNYEDVANDDSSAYCVIPAFDVFDKYADRVEDEMPGEHLKKIKTTKKCPACETENKKNAKICASKSCDYEFPIVGSRMKSCKKCEQLNPIGAKRCQNCDEEFGIAFEIVAKDIMREGVKVRQETYTEEEARENELASKDLLQLFSEETDPWITNIARGLTPENALSASKKIKGILDKITKKHEHQKN